MHGAIITNLDYQTQLAEKALAGKKHKEAEQKEKKMKKKPNMSTGKKFREMLKMMRNGNIEEDDIDMSTDEEVAEKRECC